MNRLSDLTRITPKNDLLLASMPCSIPSRNEDCSCANGVASRLTVQTKPATICMHDSTNQVSGSVSRKGECGERSANINQTPIKMSIVDMIDKVFCVISL